MPQKKIESIATGHKSPCQTNGGINFVKIEKKKTEEKERIESKKINR